VALVGAALLTLGGVASADQKSDALFQKAREALSSARTLEAEVVQRFEAGDQKGGYTANVRLMKPNLGEVVIKPEGGRPGETTISDGKNLYRIMPGQKQYMRMPANPKGVGGLAGFFMPLKAFFEPEALAAGAGHKSAGMKEVDGKSYEVVQFTSSQPPEGPTRYYFDENGLLAGMEIDLKDGPREGIFRLWLKNLRLNAPLTEKQFAYTPPAGFKLHDPFAELNAALLKVGTSAPDFRLPQPDGGNLSLSGVRKGKKAVLINFWFYG
jgi:outer membrane lipoprotein-sorting protein